MSLYSRSTVTLEVQPCEMGESARFKIVESGASVSFLDSEEANDFLKCFFGYTDQDIANYWGLE